MNTPSLLRRLDAVTGTARQKALDLSPSRMKYRSALSVGFLSMLGLAIATAVMALWTAKQAQNYHAHSTLAHSILESYLSLSANTNALFKQFGDTLLIGDKAEGNPELEARLLRDLESDLRRARSLVQLEQAYEHDERTNQPSDDLLRLAGIEVQIRQVIEEYREVQKLKDSGRRTRAWSKLTGVLEQSVDQNFAGLISLAIEDEKEDNRAANIDAQNALERLYMATSILLALSAITCATALYLLRRRLERPLIVLAEGAQTLARGNLSHRIAVEGVDEFAGLARQMNVMAEDLESAHLALERSRTDLDLEMKRRTAELQSVTQAFENADQVRRRFLADVSHELRTPLTVIRGEAEVALRGTEMSPKEYRSSLERIVEQAAHTASLVDDLLFIARRDAGDARLKVEQVDVDALLAEVCQDVSVIARGRNVFVTCIRCAGTGLVAGDRVRLRQLMLIVLDNAIRYSLADGEVRTVSERQGHQVIVRIEDNGIGIAPEDLERIFERNYRGSHASHHYTQGTGLGLPMARAIAEAHDGKVEITSQPKQGTVVTISLPAGPNGKP